MNYNWSYAGATPTLLEMAEITVERAAYARLYLHVLFPNGDGDIARDQWVYSNRPSKSVPLERILVTPFFRLHRWERHLWTQCLSILVLLHSVAPCDWPSRCPFAAWSSRFSHLNRSINRQHAFGSRYIETTAIETSTVLRVPVTGHFYYMPDLFGETLEKPRADIYYVMPSGCWVST